MEAITQAVIAETIVYGRRETGFVEGKEAKFDVGLNCATLQIGLTKDRLVGENNSMTGLSLCP